MPFKIIDEDNTILNQSIKLHNSLLGTNLKMTALHGLKKKLRTMGKYDLI